MRSQHIWTTRDDDGRKREVRVTKFGGAWQFQAKFKDEADWTYFDVPLLGDLRDLREIIFRKYQRRRASFEDLVAVEQMLQDQLHNE